MLNGLLLCMQCTCSQYRKGAPSVYGILRYEVSKAPPSPADIIKPGAIVDKKW